MVELERSRKLLSDFGLSTAAELLDVRLEEAIQHEMTYATFLCGLLDMEEQERNENVIYLGPPLISILFEKYSTKNGA
jgi:hypothetical protein